MSPKAELVETVQHSEPPADQRLERYFSGVAKVVDRTSKVLVKLPSGEKVSERYAEFATKATDAQKDALLKLVHTQAKFQSWARRESASASAA